MALLAATAVALAVAFASTGAWLLTRAELFRQVDTELTAQSRAVERLPHPLSDPLTAQYQELSPHPVPGLVQIVGSDGGPIRPAGQAALPVTERDRQVTAGQLVLQDGVVAGVPVRMASRRTPDGRLVQVARPVTDVQATLDRLAVLLALVGVAGVGVAALAGRAVARTGLAPVVRVAQAAEEVARTTDLRAAIPVEGDDEIARVARSLNRMLTALDTARTQQRRLVEDAGHELRTPLTSLRANIELLLRAGSDERLSQTDRQALLADVRDQTVELGHLFAELVDLAREDNAPEELGLVCLDDVVAYAVARARRHYPVSAFLVRSERVQVLGRRHVLHRAIGNLLDNAAKFGPPGGEVEVSLALSREGDRAVLDVLDRGPGIPSGQRELVFERFYRSSEARAVPGSGLGLAIVRQAAALHQGDVWLGPRAGGGAHARLTVPVNQAQLEPPADDPDSAGNQDRGGPGRSSS